jgi:hypothetical protein
VPKGTSRLRIALSAAHDIAELDRLLGALSEFANPSSWPSPRREREVVMR